MGIAEKQLQLHGKHGVKQKREVIEMDKSQKRKILNYEI